MRIKKYLILKDDIGLETAKKEATIK